MRAGKDPALDGAAGGDGHISGAAFLRCGPWVAAAAGHCGRAAAGGRDSAAGGGCADLRQAPRPDPAGCVRHGAGGAGHPGLLQLPAAAAAAALRRRTGVGAAGGGLLQRLGGPVYRYGLRQAQAVAAGKPPQDCGGRRGRPCRRRAGHGDLPDHLLPLYPAAPAHRRLHPHGSGGRSHGPAGRPELFGHQTPVRHQGLWAAAAGSRRRAGPVRQCAVCCAGAVAHDLLGHRPITRRNDYDKDCCGLGFHRLHRAADAAGGAGAGTDGGGADSQPPGGSAGAAGSTAPSEAGGAV